MESCTAAIFWLNGALVILSLQWLIKTKQIIITKKKKTNAKNTNYRKITHL